MTKPMSRTSGRPAAAPRTSPGRPGRRRWWALAAVAASFLAVGLDSYIVVTALPTFSAKLGASESQLQWIIAAYTLAGAGLMLPVGQLGDKLGRRKVLLASLVLLGVASAAASRVTGAGELIALRAVMGAGGAAIMPMGQAITRPRDGTGRSWPACWPGR
jgi:MFS family permease